MISTEKLVYFSSADPTAVSDRQIFHEKLIDHVLFQSQPGLISDQFFFYGPAVDSVLPHSIGGSLLEIALREGLIVPAFRGDCSFRGAFENVRALYQRQGGDKVLQKLKDYPERLDHSLRHYRQWGSVNFAEEYQKRLETLFRRDDPGSIEESLNTGWKRIEQWRENIVKNAAVRTLGHSGQPGVQRGDLYSELSKLLGGSESVRTTKELLGLPLSHEKRQDVQLYLKFLNDVYYANQAAQLNAAYDFPEFDHRTEVVVRVLSTPGTPGRATDHMSTSVSSRTLPLQINLPALEELKKLDPHVLIGLRKSYGKPYLDAADEWSAAAKKVASIHPADFERAQKALENAKICKLKAEKALSKYAETILIERKISKPPEAVQIILVAGLLGEALEKGIEASIKAVTESDVSGGVLLIALTTAWVLLRRNTKRSKRVQANLWHDGSFHVQMIRK
jgi:hypothetical protein